MSVEVHGGVAAGFEGVADAFASNFADRGDTAASCAIYVGGNRVVDLWAGATAEGPWTADTRTAVFSVSKGVATICLLMAVQEGHLQLDASVVSVWPEFGAQGKAGTTIRQVLAHRPGCWRPRWT